MSESIWQDAEVISTYTRAQAIDDGVLIDVGAWQGGIFKHPVAFTAALFAEVSRGKGSDVETLKARIWDVCYMATVPTAHINGPDSFYPVTVGNRTLRLRANCGPGDRAEPVMTIGFPEDF